ncbi:MAG: TonB-dependent receptor [Pseudomonadales bacterium]
MKYRNTVKFATPVLALAAAVSTFTTQAEERERLLEEVLVTALKGATGTALSDTAMGINAISGATLEDLAATSINAVIERSPGASLTKTNPRATTIQIRGISASRGDALVGYYIDDFSYVSLLGVSTPEIIPFDLERVEVLKGPQGTLYGAGSTGGTIRILSNKADTEGGFSGKIELGAHTISGGGDGHTIAGVVNIPIVADKLAVRLTAHNRDRAGWLDYINGPDDFNELDGKNYKVQFGFTPNARLRLDVGYHKYDVESAPIYSDSDYNFEVKGGTDHAFTSTTTAITVGAITPIFQEMLGPYYPLYAETINQQLTDVYTQNIAALMPPTPGSVTETAAGPAGTLQVDSGEYELYTTALTYEFDSIQLYATANRMEEESYGLGQMAGPRDGFQGSSLETNNYEIRLASKNDGPLSWTAGYYSLEHEEHFDLSAAIAPSADLDTTNPAGVVTLYGLGPDPVVIPLPSVTALDQITLVESSIESDQQAVFGEVSYAFTDKMELTVGLRYFEDERKSTERSEFYSDLMAEQGLDNPSEETFDGVTGRINLKVNWTDDLMNYFSVSTGQRSGAPNFGLTQTAVFVNRPAGFKAQPFTDEENLTAYEIGAKWFATDSLYFDTAIYYNDWQDTILELTEWIIDPQFGALTTSVIKENPGDARSYGLEASMNWAATETITVGAGVNLMESEYLDTLPGASVSDGDPIQGVPDWTGFASLDYNRSVSWFEGSSIVAGIFASYTGEKYAYGSGGETAKTDGFARADVRAGLQTDSWSVTLHVKNLTDSDDRVFNATGSLARDPYDIYMQPRTTELVLKYAF